MGEEDIRLHLKYRINEFRKKEGRNDSERAALELHDEMSRGAKAHSEHAVDRIPQIRKREIPAHAPGHYWKGFEGENIGWHEGHEHPHEAADKVMYGWGESPVHRQNMLNARRFVGVDIAHRWLPNGRRRIFATARFK